VVSGVHDADLHGESCVIRMSMWLTVLLCESCESWCEGRHGRALWHVLYISSPIVHVFFVKSSELNSQDTCEFIAAMFIAKNSVCCASSTSFQERWYACV
jgi:hypothetical protein